MFRIVSRIDFFVVLLNIYKYISICIVINRPLNKKQWLSIDNIIKVVRQLPSVNRKDYR